jgi:carbamoyl-phosphate synthase large subunit
VNDVTVLHKVREFQRKPNIIDYLQSGKIDLVINIPTPNNGTQYSEVLKDEYIIRRLAVEFNIPVITNLELASALTKVLAVNNGNSSSVRSLNEYMEQSEWTLW